MRLTQILRKGSGALASKELTEKEMAIITKIAEEHSNKTFGYLDKDDLKNEIWVICLEKIETYSEEKGKLENYLRVLVKNRLVNKFKDITKSVSSPCPKCPFYAPGIKPGDCSEYGEEKYQCNKWRNYQLSKNSRNSLLNAMEPQIERDVSSAALNKMTSDEIFLIAGSGLNKRFQKDLIDLKNGNKITNQRKKRLQKEIAKVLVEFDEKIMEYYPEVIQLTIKES